MPRLTVTYEGVPDKQRLDDHVDLCRQMPGASSFDHGSVTRVLFGAPLAYLVEWTFADDEALRDASRSREFKEIADDAAAMDIPHSVYVLAISETRA